MTQETSEVPSLLVTTCIRGDERAINKLVVVVMGGGGDDDDTAGGGGRRTDGGGTVVVVFLTVKHRW